MNEKTINEQYTYIRSLLEEKRLNVRTGIYVPAWSSCKPPTSIGWSICATAQTTQNAGMYTENS